jgi:hypothetical protein
MVATLPASSLAGPWTRRKTGRLVGTLAGRALWLLVPTGLCLAACTWVFGRPALEFLRFQSARGLDIGSLYASGLLILREMGVSGQTAFEFGAYTLRSPAATVIAKAWPAVAALALGFTYLTVLRRILGRPEVYEHGGEARLVDITPSSFIEGAVLLLMVSISTSKVFSPQFLLWLVPVLPLLSVKARSTWAIWFVFGMACAMTTVIFPLRYRSDVVGSVSFGGTSILASGPTGLGVALLLIRNVLFGAATVLVCRRARQEQAASPGPRALP